MKRQEMIKKNTDFKEIIQSGKVLKSNYFNIFYKDSLEEKIKFGLAVSKKIGNAVERNHLKRQMRAIIDNHKKEFKNYQKYIIMIKGEMKTANFKDIDSTLVSLLERIKK